MWKFNLTVLLSICLISNNFSLLLLIKLFLKKLNETMGSNIVVMKTGNLSYQNGSSSKYSMITFNRINTKLWKYDGEFVAKLSYFVFFVILSDILFFTNFQANFCSLLVILSDTIPGWISLFTVVSLIFNFGAKAL